MWSSLLLRHGFWGLALTFLVAGRGAESSSYFRIPGSRSSLACYCSLFLAGGYGSLRAEFHFTGFRVYQDLSRHLHPKSYEFAQKRPRNIRVPFIVDFAKFQIYDAS